MTQKTKLPDYSPLFKPRWSGDVGGYTKEQLQAYGAACAAHAMQSQAERIKEWEAEIKKSRQHQWKQCMTIKTWAERLEHIPDGEITTSAHIQSAMLEEIEELRTQLAEIAAAEPHYWEYKGSLYQSKVNDACEALFTRPMPAVNPVWCNGDEPLVGGGLIRQGRVDMQIRTALSKYKGAK
jgi:hypothetical protein